jgi:hypothetical protein
MLTPHATSRSCSTSVVYGPLVLDEHGFGRHGTRAAGTDEPGDRRQQMQKEDGEFAHRTILARSRARKKSSWILEFAMHKWRTATNIRHESAVSFAQAFERL